MNACSQVSKFLFKRIKKPFFGLTTYPNVFIILLNELWFVLNFDEKCSVINRPKQGALDIEVLFTKMDSYLVAKELDLYGGLLWQV